MCHECGCGAVGSSTGVTDIPGGILDVTRDDESGLTSEKRKNYLDE